MLLLSKRLRVIAFEKFFVKSRLFLKYLEKERVESIK
jgi:hypothetical protein